MVWVRVLYIVTFHSAASGVSVDHSRVASHRASQTTTMSFKLASITVAAADPSGSTLPIPEEEEYYSSWSLFLVCMLLVLSLWTSYYLQIKKIRAIHETLVSIFAGMAVGLIVRLAPGTMIREMLVSSGSLLGRRSSPGWTSSAEKMEVTYRRMSLELNHSQ